MSQVHRKVLKDLFLIILLAVSLFGFTVQTFIFKTDVGVYLLATSIATFFFAITLKNLKYGLPYLCTAILLSVLLSWSILILPPSLIGEEAMVNYITEVFAYFAARFILLSLPTMLISLIIGSIVADGI